MVRWWRAILRCILKVSEGPVSCARLSTVAARAMSCLMPLFHESLCTLSPPVLGFTLQNKLQAQKPLTQVLLSRGGSVQDIYCASLFLYLNQLSGLMTLTWPEKQSSPDSVGRGDVALIFVASAHMLVIGMHGGCSENYE